jgi:glyoxylase-like metal-dependent hydrolase (beta-lactamase superfamily II)
MTSSSPPFVTSRRIGDATISVISEGSVRVPLAEVLDVPDAEWRVVIPEADAEGKADFGQNVIHIQLGMASILVDTGLDDPSSAWSRQYESAYYPVRTPGLRAGLAGIGIRPEEITHVLVTHAHWDHIVGATVERDGRHTPRFPNAHYFLNRTDWEDNPERTEPDSELAVRLGAIAHAGLLELVDGDREIIPGVILIHAPGESPGHTIVRVSSGGKRFYALGDLFHHACEVEHPDWMSAERDRAAMRASRDHLFAEILPGDALLVFTHAPFPGWGRIVATDTGQRWK